MQSRQHFDLARVVLGESRRGFRQATKTALLERGFRHVIDTDEMEGVRVCLTADMVDLVICDGTLEGRYFCELVRRLRHHETGDNPFIVVLATTEDASEGAVRHLIRCGADDVILKPLAAEALVRRVERFISNRKPFAVTDDYIGPDRRGAPRPGEPEPLPLIEVPNPLQARILNQITQSMLKRAVQDCWIRINECRIGRHSEQIERLVQPILDAYASGTVNEATAGHLALLLRAAEDLSARLAGSRFDHVGKLAVTLIDVARRIGGPGQATDHRALDLLPRLSSAIAAALVPVRESVRTSHAIRETVSRYSWGPQEGGTPGRLM